MGLVLIVLRRAEPPARLRSGVQGPLLPQGLEARRVAPHIRVSLPALDGLCAGSWRTYSEAWRLVGGRVAYRGTT